MAQVLIVDDDQDIRDAVRFILEDAGHEVAEASDGKSALRMLRDCPASLVVLLDLLIPQLNGIELLKEIIADPQLKARHAYLLMTADSAGLRQQADLLLPEVSAQIIGKPFDLDKLLAMIDDASHSLA
jgi:CheY-like chemotaxis protein